MLMAACCASALGREPGFAEYRSVRDSLRTVAPSHRARWLQARGLDVSEFVPTYRPDSATGLRLVGKYGRGPALSVTGQDSLVFVAMGSEVAVVDAAIPSIPHVLAEIQLGFLPSRVRVRDSLLLVCGAAVEVWSIATPSLPRFISRLPMSVYDFCIRDTLLFLMSRDTFMVYNIAAPASPQRLGAYPDSGYATTITGNTVVIMLASGLGFVDVSNPASPHRVGSYGGYLWSACARGNICCMTAGNPNQPTWLQLQVIDISDPASAFPLGSLDSAGGYDLVIEDSMLYASGFYTGNHEFQIIGLGDSAHPRRVGACLTYGDNSGVWVDSQSRFAFVADRHMGLAVIDKTIPSSPFLDTLVLRADQARDVSVKDGLAFVADFTAGHKVLDVTDPTRPTEIGALDTLSGGFDVNAVAAMDSFICAGWWPQPKFRTVNVVDPTQPVNAGGCTTFDDPQAIVVRDSWAYVAQRLRFQIFNVARPRAPVLVGSCVLPDESNDLWLSDTIAYVANLGLVMVSVANPAAPRILGTWPGEALGVTIRDTIAYVACVGSFVTVNVANPASPRTLDSLPANELLYDVVLVDTLAYAGGKLLHVYNVADPANVREVATWNPPYSIRRLEYVPPFVYVACYEAGVCILDTLAVGIAETPASALRNPPGLSVSPNPAHDRIVLRGARELSEVVLWDVSGRVARRILLDGGTTAVSLSGLQPGVYLCSIAVGGKRETVKLIKR
jgi:hypothetical protein